MSTISVAIIAHNEESCLSHALESVAWADQIVVVDCGSTDATPDIARRSCVELYGEPNRENLNLNKNIAIERCTGDWVLILDADEIVTDLLAGEIRRVINDPVHDGYLIPRKNYVMGRWLRRGGQYPDYQLRLFRRGQGRFPAQHVHERIALNGSVGTLHESLDHFPYPTIADLIRKGAFYMEFEAQFLANSDHQASFGKSLFYGCFRPWFRFVRRYIFKGGFKDGIPGLTVALFDLWNQTVRWLRLWEIQNAEPRAGERKP